MGKYILLLIILLATLTSCNYVLVEDRIVIQEIKLDVYKTGYKYFVTLKSDEGGVIYYRTNTQYNVGDTLRLNPKQWERLEKLKEI